MKKKLRRVGSPFREPSRSNPDSDTSYICLLLEWKVILDVSMSQVANAPLLSHSSGQPLLAYASRERLTTFLVT